MPPFVGFFPKWVVITTLVESGSYLLVCVLVLVGLFSLFYYVRVAYALYTQSITTCLIANLVVLPRGLICVTYLLSISGLILVPLFVMIV